LWGQVTLGCYVDSEKMPRRRIKRLRGSPSRKKTKCRDDPRNGNSTSNDRSCCQVAPWTRYTSTKSRRLAQVATGRPVQIGPL
jgi:hypothetical protein